MNIRHKIVIGALCAAAVISGGLAYYLEPILIIRSNMLALGTDFSGSQMARVSVPNKKSKPAPTPTPTPSLSGSTYLEDFSSGGTVEEKGSISEASGSWWVNSGAYLYRTNGIGTTIAGPLNTLNAWRVAYALSNSLDTDNGYYPQNIFRFINNGIWQNAETEAWFQITADNLTDSPNRNASNGLLLMTRYVDGNNLYYIGIRVDGTAIIKKKMNGTYYTLAQKTLPGVSGSYHRTTNPNLIPHNTWIGLRARVITNPDNTVSITEFIDIGKTGQWIEVASATDNVSYGGAILSKPGYSGIRTDFMDVSFDDFRVIAQ